MKLSLFVLIFVRWISGTMCILCTPRPMYRSTYRPTIGRYLGRYSGRHSADTLTIDYRSTVGGLSVDCLDHEYLRHLYPSIGRYSRPICRPTVGRYVDRVSADISVDMLFELIDRRSTLSVGMSVDTRPTSRPICRWCIGRLSVASEYC